MGGIDISQQNRRSHKIAIYWSPMKIFASNFTDRLTTKGTIEKSAKLSQRGSWRCHDLLLSLWDPYISRKWL